MNTQVQERKGSGTAVLASTETPEARELREMREENARLKAENERLATSGKPAATAIPPHVIAHAHVAPGERNMRWREVTDAETGKSEYAFVDAGNVVAVGRTHFAIGATGKSAVVYEIRDAHLDLLADAIASI